MVGSFVFTSIVKERYIRTPRGKENYVFTNDNKLINKSNCKIIKLL